MISVILSSALTLAAYQATINAPRTAFVGCLKAAGAKAEGAKVTVENFRAFIAGECAAQAGALKSALVSFDVKNGIKRAAAESDAVLQLDDYYLNAKEKYQSKTTPKAVQAAQPTQGSQP